MMLGSIRGACLLLCCCTLLGFGARAAHAQQIAADGAYDENALWEQGKASEWWIEDQRNGADYVEWGVQRENPADIQEGLLILGWGWKHQASDGSFPGMGDGTYGASYHSIGLFIEAAARAALLLKNYHPVTYTLASSAYAAVITQYAKDCQLSAYWLLQPAVLAAGKQYDLMNTHRRYIMAAAFAETGALAGDSTLSGTATGYAQDGLTMQLGTGWQAAIPKAVNGVTAPATLIAPGGSIPSNTANVVGAYGVNPENGGYDVSYQIVGVMYAAYYYPYVSDPTLRQQLRTMLENAMNWEQKWVDPAGHVTTTGSTRVGIEIAHDGTVKVMATTSAVAAFSLGGVITGDGKQQVYSNRIRYVNSLSTSGIASDGAVGTNEDLDTNRAYAWSIALQKTGVDWVTAGITREYDGLIRQGLDMFNWAWAQQASNGSFPGTVSAFYGTSQFLEEVGHSILLLKSYHPLTYTPDAAFYANVIATYTQKLHAAGDWMTSPTVAAAGWKGDAPYTSRRYLVASALEEVSALSGDAALATAALPYLQDGLSRQLANGENPEQGTYNINYQGQGITYACRYYDLVSNQATLASLKAMITLGLDWEMQWIDPAGNITAISDPYYPSIDLAYESAYPITDIEAFQVESNRIEGAH